jgi:hypothetical protein
MPMHWRRITDSGAFILAVGVAAWMRYGLDLAWWTSLLVGAIVFIITPFLVSRVWAKRVLRRMERAALKIEQEGIQAFLEPEDIQELLKKGVSKEDIQKLLEKNVGKGLDTNRR